MRKLIDGIKAEIEGFLEQRCDQLMIVSCSDTDAPIVLKIMQEVDQANASDAFLLCADDFVATLPYVSVAIERLREVRAADGWLAEQGRDPFPPVPDTVSDRSLTPIHRLARAMTYAVSLLPKAGGHRLLWAMVPISIGNRKDHLDLVSAFLVRSVAEPGLPGLRIIFRDQQGTAAALPRLTGGVRARLIDVDLGPEALQSALADEADDPQLPQEQRAAAALQRALLDAAHGWTRKALEQGATARPARPLPAHRQQRAAGAGAEQHWRYLPARPETRSGLPVVRVRRAAGGQIGVARSAADGGPQPCRHCPRLPRLCQGGAALPSSRYPRRQAALRGLVYAREQRGISQERQRAFHRAVQSWEAAAGICRTAGMTPQLRTNLGHLLRGYPRGRLADVDRVESELRQLKAEERSR